MTKMNIQLLVLSFGLGGALLTAATADTQQRFATPRDLVQATIAAAEHDDTATLLNLFGPQGKNIVQSGDPADDKESRAEFAISAHEKLHFDEDRLRPNRVTFSVGSQDWPFPVPIIRKDGKWQYDSANGRFEVLARRVGRNELNAMELCRGYAAAQLEYAAAPRDADHILKYAQKMMSSPGRHDGLYSGDVPDSLVTRAFAEAAEVKPSYAHHGYYFQVLKSQGPDAAGGSFNYDVNGKMIGGFALVAWPAEYGVSGVKTFIINHQGVVYGKDLGPASRSKARQMTQFNPDKSWRQMVRE